MRYIGQPQFMSKIRPPRGFFLRSRARGFPRFVPPRASRTASNCRCRPTSTNGSNPRPLENRDFREEQKGTTLRELAECERVRMPVHHGGSAPLGALFTAPPAVLAASVAQVQSACRRMLQE